MKLALITLSTDGARLLTNLKAGLQQADCYLHADIEGKWEGQRFPSVKKLTKNIFSEYTGLIYIAPCGVVVRALDGVMGHKTTDPAVVVLDVAGRYAISLLSGHEGGANELALRIANIAGAEPVITTTSEARKDIIVGIGCRRGVSSEALIEAILDAVGRTGFDKSDIRLLSSIDIKANEKGLIEASRALQLPLRFISSGEVRNTPLQFAESTFVKERVGLPAVAEPVALLAGRRTELLLHKTIYPGITIAIARERCLWWESAQEPGKTEHCGLKLQ